MPSDTKVCPFCAECIEAAALRCRYCDSDLSADIAEPSAVPRGDEEVIARDPRGSRGPLRMGLGILGLVVVASGAFLLVPGHRAERHTEPFNIFVKVERSCQADHGSVVTTDAHGTPTAFATPDGPERYWCVSRQYLTSIGHGPEDPFPPISKIPSEFTWRWPSTTYGE